MWNYIQSDYMILAKISGLKIAPDAVKQIVF